MRIEGKPLCASGDVAAWFAYAHTVHMAKGDSPPHYLREWRKAKGKTLEWVAEYVGMSHQNLGKVERFKVPYSQTLLEKLADLYQTNPGSLVMRNPAQEDALYTVWEQATPAKRAKIQKMLQILDDTGTDG